MEIIKGKLYKSKISELVVMATENKIDATLFFGVVIDSSDQDEIGFFSDSCVSSSFEPYSAEIIIKEVIDFSKVQFVEMNDGEIVFGRGDNDKKTFAGVNIATNIYDCFEKSDVKKVVTPNFK
jgi:hypothetical protein